MTCEVDVDNRTTEDVDLVAVGRVVAAVVESETPAAAEAGVVLVTPDEMQALNREHRGHDEVTDVLAFPIDGDDAPPVGHPRMLGDVVVCLERAAEQAAEDGHPLGRELTVLAVHGALHLLGHDHERDSGEMLALQDRLCAGIPDVGWRR
jgi:probable rRNA maturation factor